MIAIRPKSGADVLYVFNKSWVKNSPMELPDLQLAIYPTVIGAEILVMEPCVQLDQDAFAAVLCAGTVMFDVMCISLYDTYHTEPLLQYANTRPAPSGKTPIAPVLLSGLSLTEDGWSFPTDVVELPRRYGVAYGKDLVGPAEFVTTEYVAAHALASAINCFADPNNPYHRNFYSLTERRW